MTIPLSRPTRTRFATGAAIWLVAASASAEIGVEHLEAAAQDAQPEAAITVPDPDGPARGARQKERTSVLSFLNGDSLHGRLGEVSRDTLVWHHEQADAPIRFSPGTVDTVVLEGPTNAPGGTKGNSASQVTLTNGDRLRGTLVGLDEEALELDTWYAGRLSIKKRMLKTIRPDATVSRYVYEGPRSLENWLINNQHGNDSWRYAKGAFYAPMNSHNCTIGKDVGLPDRSEIAFDFAWRGNNPYMTVCIYTDDIRSTNGNSYMLQFQGNYVSVYRRNQHNSRSLDNAQINQIRNQGKARVRICADKNKNTLALLMDDTLVKQWTDPAGFAGAGAGIVFMSYNQQPARIANIQVSEWDGEIATSESVEHKNTDLDLVHLANKDKTSGECVGIQAGKLSFETDFGDLNVPLDRIAVISFATDNQYRARRNKHDVQAFFDENSAVTLDLKSINDGTLEGHSENFGDATFRMDAFKTVRFNIYEERPDAEEDPWGDGGAIPMEVLRRW